MPSDNNDSLQVVKALTEVSGAVATTSVGVAELRSEVKDFDRDMRARVDNLDRSHQELRLTLSKDIESRDILIRLLKEEREERRQITALDRTTSQEVRKEARADMKEQQALLRSAAQAVWAKGGQWLVLGLVLIILSLLNKELGLGLPFFDLIAGKDTPAAPASPQVPSSLFSPTTGG